VFALGVGAASHAEASNREDAEAWNNWKVEHGRFYGSEDEESYRFSVFQANLRRFEARTANSKAVFGPDFSADLTKEEFRRKFTSSAHVEPNFMEVECFSMFSPPPHLLTPEEIADILKGGTSVDWREKGAVTAVKDQGPDGTCWAFAAIGVMEGINVVQGGNPLVSVSEQELIDCCSTTKQGWWCAGCVACSLDWFAYIKEGAASEASYPYRPSIDGSCSMTSAVKTTARITNHTCAPNDKVTHKQDQMLARLHTLGPAGFLVDGGCLQGYRSGVISDCPGGQTDHATTLVGAGVEGSTPYWIVKNSWGVSFGENGFYRVERDTYPAQLGNLGGIFGIDGSGSVLV